ncbi:hypothetical protein FOH22_17150 [Acetobacter tropicalis]|nr:hypothetical protein FOH22_17150 [Acetobacter tropicalis]
MKRVTAPNLLKTQTGCHRKNRQSNRQKPEITRQAHQATVLRSLHLPCLAYRIIARNSLMERQE